MLQKTAGIVLRTLKYNDAWNIIEIYTELFGRASFLISASRSKKTSMKPALLQPLSMLECEADFRPLTRLYKIKEIRSHHLFTSIPYNPHKTAMALFLAEFLCNAIREETENRPLFEYLTHSIAWLDEVNEGYSNFHLVFLMRLSRFLGLYPNLENYREGDYFDMLNAGFTSGQFREHSSYITPGEASRIIGLMRMNYKTMYLFKMNRSERMRCLTFINDYYRIHLPGFPQLKSLKILQELFD